MKALLFPLITFLSSISYKAKFILIGLFAVVYTSFLVYQNFISLNDNVEFSQKEVAGANLLPSVKNLLLSTQQLRGTTASYLSGNDAVKDKISSLQLDVESKLKILNETFSDTIVEGLTQDVNTINDDLKALMPQALNLDAKVAFERYTDIVQKELDLIVLIGDSSNLILDPDLDSFYMMDAVVNKLPHIFKNVAKIRALGSAVLSKKTMTNEEATKISTFWSNANQDLHSIESGFESAYRANSSLKALIDEKKINFIDKFSLFKEDIEKHLISEQDMSADIFFKVGTKVINSAEILYDDALFQLTTLLKKRVNGFKNREKTLALVASTFAILLGLIFMAFYYSVSGAVGSVVEQLKEIEKNSDLSKDLHIDTKDELSEIATAYNSFRYSLQKTMQDALIAVENSNNDANKMLDEAKEIDENSKDMSKVISMMAQKGEDIKSELVASKEMAQNSKDQISTAYETLQHATESIQNLASQVEESSHKEMDMADKINQLSQDASDVKSVLTVINDIAEQTNLLALNAAIEAARAGEHGRGFAVVADEVRQLAEKTQKSLSEINATINVIMQNIIEASSEMNKNAKDISSITQTSENVLKEVEQVNTIMDKATKQMENSAKNIEKNAVGVEMMAKDLLETDNLSSSNSKKMDVISDSSSLLARNVNEIKEKISAFRL